MSLHHEPDVSVADWFTGSRDDWARLCSIGPSGFARYARLFCPLPPDRDPTDLSDVSTLEGCLDAAVLARLLPLLARHTSTPEDCFCALWDGCGWIEGSPAVQLLSTAGGARAATAPAFGREILDGPRVRIPNRDYLLFRGSLDQAGEWGAEDPYAAFRDAQSPHLMWPADHAWFVATEVDQPWTGIAGTVELVADLLADDGLDAEPIRPEDGLPYWRETKGPG